MVATSAFGLGVDQSDVNLVVHFNLPLSLIDYYQQAGRAGRAGQTAKCVLLYCEDDYLVNRVILKEISDKPSRKAALRALDRMKEYAESSECLTEQLHWNRRRSRINPAAPAPTARGKGRTPRRYFDLTGEAISNWSKLRINR